MSKWAEYYDCENHQLVQIYYYQFKKTLRPLSTWEPFSRT